MRGLMVLALAVLSFVSFSARATAEEVTLEHLGLELTANLETIPSKPLKTEPIVLLVHDSLGHGRMEPMAALQDGLRDLGLNSLAITLGLGLDKRHGMFDCALEQD